MQNNKQSKHKQADNNQEQNIPSAETNANTTSPDKPQKNKTLVLILIGAAVLVVLAIIITFVVIMMNNKKSSPESQSTNSETSDNSVDFGSQKKSAHFESSTPAHGMVLAAAPNQVAIDFDFDLAKPSNISIMSNGREYATSETVIDKNLTTMRRAMDVNAPDGLYSVSYKACWPDKSCHDGNFKFQIDRTKASSYVDMRGKKEVTIEMENIKFSPQNIIIDKGTKVTWVNKEGVAHYVNTDAHPAHTHQLGFNSKVLNVDANYSYTFDSAGAYPYHCSAHADQMVGNVVVI